MTRAEYIKSVEEWDPRTPLPTRTLAERQQAKDYFLSDILDTDDATQAEIEKGIDQMLERIYGTRTPPVAVSLNDEASAGS
jgi:hypothetical protein